jgi:hypothetical protein
MRRWLRLLVVPFAVVSTVATSSSDIYATPTPRGSGTFSAIRVGEVTTFKFAATADSQAQANTLGRLKVRLADLGIKYQLEQIGDEVTIEAALTQISGRTEAILAAKGDLQFRAVIGSVARSAPPFSTPPSKLSDNTGAILPELQGSTVIARYHVGPNLLHSDKIEATISSDASAGWTTFVHPTRTTLNKLRAVEGNASSSTVAVVFDGAILAVGSLDTLAQGFSVPVTSKPTAYVDAKAWASVLRTGPISTLIELTTAEVHSTWWGPDTAAGKRMPRKATSFEFTQQSGASRIDRLIWHLQSLLRPLGIADIEVTSNGRTTQIEAFGRGTDSHAVVSAIESLLPVSPAPPLSIAHISVFEGSRT